MHPTPPVPFNETQRLAALRQLCLLETPADPAFDGLTALCARTFKAPIATISLIDSERQWFKSRVGTDLEYTAREHAFCAYAIHGREPLVVLDPCGDPRFAHNPFVTSEPGVRFYAGAPLINRDGLALGTLCIVDTEPRAFGAEDTALLAEFAKVVMLRMEVLRENSFVDLPTMLPNRARFVEHLARWNFEQPGVRRAAVAVDICGIDYFWSMVKALGWRHADGYAKAAAERMVRAVAPLPLYRLSATLFGFIAEAPASGAGGLGNQALEDLLACIGAAFAVPLEHEGVPYSADVSIGACLLQGADAGSDFVRTLTIAADTARAAGVPWKIAGSGEDAGQRRAFTILSAMPPALAADNQFSLHYQPRVRLADGVCVGAEALLRWNHPVLGPVSPAEFIPLAEKTALMRRITQWVLQHGFGHVRAWQARGLQLKIGLNISAVDLDHPEFVDSLRALLDHWGVDPTGVKLEFTESALSQNSARAHDELLRACDMGFELAIDDFGTGYSNLAYLKSIPASTLKIDQSFIRRLHSDDRDSMIVPTMIRLGHDLGLRVVAEGVEKMAAYEMLRNWGCDEGQGYLMARPMPAADFESWVSQRAALRPAIGAGRGATRPMPLLAPRSRVAGLRALARGGR